MKKGMISLLVGFLLTMLLVVGCRERQVTRVMDVTTNDLTDEVVTPTDEPMVIELTEPESATNTMDEDSIIQNESVENQDEYEVSTIKAPEEVEDGLNSTIDEVIDEKTETVIIAKSENLEDIDERALMLKELDELLEDVLTTLDEVEEDDLSDDNMFDEGGD